MDVTNIVVGRWALSRPVQDSSGGWTTVAAQQQLAQRIRMYWPPRGVGGVPLVDAVLVHGMGNLVPPPDGDTVLFPRDIISEDQTLGDITAQQRQNWRDTLEAWLTGYTFTDYDGQVRIISAFSTVTAAYTLSTTFRQVARDIFKHFAHSVSRPRTSQPEVHNTEYTDNFDTDPFASRWVSERGGGVHDAGNGEMDITMDNGPMLRYAANSPGSIEQEAQVTGQGSPTAVSGDCLPGPAVRCEAGAITGYITYMFQGDLLVISRENANVRTDLYVASHATHTTNFYTLRLSAEGANGANVTLNGWQQDHGSSKPSDPGWFGDNGSSTTGAVVDSDVDRLDDASVHLQGGIGGRASGATEHDTRHDYWKVRAISDRAGAPTPPNLVFVRRMGAWR